jgi:acetyltransferase-like isoleucine patch superfamily enzyme
MTRYWSACGPLLGTARFVRRALVFVGHRLSTRVWRSALAELGAGSLIQTGVQIERPRRVRVGRRCLVTAGAVVSTETEAGELRLADGVQINAGARLDHSGGLTLLEGALVSEGATLMTHSHGQDPHSAPIALPLTVGRDVWIGAHAIVLPGVESIGDGAVVGAGAVVTRAVAPDAVVAGNPARVIGTRRTSGAVGSRDGAAAALAPLAARKAG